jgi:hypothetical protein
MACWLETAQHLKCPDGGIDAPRLRCSHKSSARAKTLPTIRNSKQLLFSLQFPKSSLSLRSRHRTAVKRFGLLTKFPCSSKKIP